MTQVRIKHKASSHRKLPISSIPLETFKTRFLEKEATSEKGWFADEGKETKCRVVTRNWQDEEKLKPGLFIVKQDSWNSYSSK